VFRKLRSDDVKLLQRAKNLTQRTQRDGGHKEEGGGMEYGWGACNLFEEDDAG
jgi:hypothetical protein